MTNLLLRGSDAEPIKAQGFASVYNTVADNVRVLPGAFHVSAGGCRLTISHVDHIRMASTLDASLRVWDTPIGPTWEADLHQDATGLWLRQWLAGGAQCSYRGKEETRVAGDRVTEIVSCPLEEISVCPIGWFPTASWTTETDPRDLPAHAKALWHQFAKAKHRALPTYADVQRRQRAAANRAATRRLPDLSPADPIFAGMDRGFVRSLCDLAKHQRYVAAMIERGR